MSLLARTNVQQSQKPQYKDYVTFLESYRNGKKDDQNSVVSTDSGLNSSLSHSSSNSSISDCVQRNGFKEPAKPTVKTEMYIEIKSPAASPKYTKVFEVQNVNCPSEASVSVSNTAKIFENNGDSLKAKHSFSKKTTIGEISKKFEDNGSSGINVAKLPPKRSTSIGGQKPRNFNAVPKPFKSSTLPRNSSINPNHHFPAISRPSLPSPKPQVISTPYFSSSSSSPEPPRCSSESTDSALSSLSISPSPPQSISPPPTATMLPPPPPPLPPPNFAPKSVSNCHAKPMSVQKVLDTRLPTQKKPVQSNGPDGLVTPNGTLDRNDPRVKKAVYGALRNMYGAFHDQANDYLATLPKNRVRKNNGLDSIINSIASQGGLDKLNGRVNPKAEAE
ncbi:hypothetical protein GWI33_020778 [Rhynchophorus ferrugineus]|uniref:Uncharacterized protein n=1 Tax=Rhynchophorus ferrugineus TaxID=354439 RepID=A0A834M3R4_RHYFE|nr:hypothetical protein GWI33_020778 [Rhynchophorus ferrugineus]